MLQFLDKGINNGSHRKQRVLCKFTKSNNRILQYNEENNILKKKRAEYKLLTTAYQTKNSENIFGIFAKISWTPGKHKIMRLDNAEFNRKEIARQIETLIHHKDHDPKFLLETGKWRIDNEQKYKGMVSGL